MPVGLLLVAWWKPNLGFVFPAGGLQAHCIRGKDVLNKWENMQETRCKSGIMNNFRTPETTSCISHYTNWIICRVNFKPICVPLNLIRKNLEVTTANKQGFIFWKGWSCRTQGLKEKKITFEVTVLLVSRRWQIEENREIARSRLIEV